MLGSGWRSSADRVVLGSGDADGFHLLVADAADGYAWRTVATLSEPGIETDQWIGNACVTGVRPARGGRVRAADLHQRARSCSTAAASPRSSTCAPARSASCRCRTSLAYFNPGCGAGEPAVLTQGGDQDLGRTRLLRLDAATGALSARDRGARPAHLARCRPRAAASSPPTAARWCGSTASGARRVLARDRRRAVPAGRRRRRRRGLPGAHAGADRRGGPAASAPAATAADHAWPTGVADRTGRHRPAAAAGCSSPAPAATRPCRRAGGQRLASTSPAGRRVSDARASWRSPRCCGPARRTRARRSPTRPAPRPLRIAATALATGRPRVDVQRARPGATASGGRAADRSAPSPALDRCRGGGGAALAGDPTDPADFAERYCSVPRNDPRNQAMQPKPRQVEWAVDQAVRGTLTSSAGRRTGRTSACRRTRRRACSRRSR